jgi:hypothetical protein
MVKRLNECPSAGLLVTLLASLMHQYAGHIWN